MTWNSAQTYCKNVTSGSVGRLATFANCSAYTSVNSNFPSNTYSMWIGIQNATSGPVWADPYGACSQQEVLAADLETTCNGSTWDPSSQNCIGITGNWTAFQGYSCSSALNSTLCEFGKFRNTLYGVTSVMANKKHKDDVSVRGDEKNQFRVLEKAIEPRHELNFIFNDMQRLHLFNFGGFSKFLEYK